MRAKGEAGRQHVEYVAFVNEAARVADIITCLTEIDEDENMELGPRLTKIIDTASNFILPDFNADNLFKMEMRPTGAVYRLPRMLYDIIVAAYLKKATKAQVFNSATQLEISGTSLPMYDESNALLVQKYQEEISAAAVQFWIKYYFPKAGYFYVRKDFSAK